MCSLLMSNEDFLKIIFILLGAFIGFMSSVGLLCLKYFMKKRRIEKLVSIQLSRAVKKIKILKHFDRNKYPDPEFPIFRYIAGEISYLSPKLAQSICQLEESLKQVKISREIISKNFQIHIVDSPEVIANANIHENCLKDAEKEIFAIENTQRIFKYLKKIDK